MIKIDQLKTDQLKRINKKKFFEFFDSFGEIGRSKYICDPLSEYDILDLQEKFLNNGIHYITVDSIKFGRELVCRFLKSLNCYYENAILTIYPQKQNLEEIFSDIYYELLQRGYTSESKNLLFNDFFIEAFYYDFMFIEASQELVDSKWFLNFFSSIKNNEIDRHIPILVVSYNQQ